MKIKEIIEEKVLEIKSILGNDYICRYENGGIVVTPHYSRYDLNDTLGLVKAKFKKLGFEPGSISKGRSRGNYGIATFSIDILDEAFYSKKYLLVVTSGRFGLS